MPCLADQPAEEVLEEEEEMLSLLLSWLSPKLCSPCPHPLALWGWGRGVGASRRSAAEEQCHRASALGQFWPCGLWVLKPLVLVFACRVILIFLFAVVCVVLQLPVLTLSSVANLVHAFPAKYVFALVVFFFKTMTYICSLSGSSFSRMRK